MRIYFFLDSFPVYSETFIYNQLFYLLEEGYSISILSIKRGDSLVHEKISNHKLKNKVNYLRHGFSFKLIFNIIQSPLISLRIINEIKFRKAIFYINNLDNFRLLNNTIIHSHFGKVGEMVGYLTNIRFLQPLRFVHSFHGFDLLPNSEKYYCTKYFNLFKHCDSFSVNSKYTFDILNKVFEGKSAKVNLLPVALDTKYFSKKYITKPKSFRIVFVGRLISWKAPILAIEIVKMLQENGYQVALDIIGEGIERRVCEESIAKHNLQDYVTLWGALDQKEIILKFEEASLFIAPGITDPETGRAENQGLVIQEAQSMEIPVIVSNAGGMKYGVVEGVTGYVIEEGNLDSFVDRIIYLIENPEVREEMGKRGRDFVCKNFDYAVIGEKLLNLYKA